MADQTTFFGVDANDAIKGFEDLTAKFTGLRSSISEVTKVVTDYNTVSGKGVTQIRALDEANRQLDLTIRQSGQTYSFQALKVQQLSKEQKDNTSIVQEAIQAQKEFSSQLNESAQKSALSSLQQNTRARIDSLKEESKVRDSLISQASQAQRELSSQTNNAVQTNALSALQQNAKARIDAIKQETAARKDALKDQLAFEAQQAQAFRANQAQQVIPSALQAIGFDASKLNSGQIQAARIAINNLNNAYISNTVSAQQLQQAVTALNTGSLTPLSGGAAVAAGQLGNLNSIMKSTTQTGGQLITSFGRIAVIFAFRQVLFSLVDGFRQSISAAADFQNKLLELEIVSGKSKGDVQDLGNSITRLSEKFGLSRIDVAKAKLVSYRTSVVGAKDSNEILENGINLGLVTFVKAEEATRSLEAALEAYRLKATDAKEVSQLLFATTQQGSANLSDLENLFSRTGLVALKLGVNIKEVAAAFVLLKQQNLSASESITLITTALNKLDTPSDKLQKVLGQAGFGSPQAAINALHFSGVVDLLAKAAEKAGDNFEVLGKETRTFRSELALTNQTGKLDALQAELSGQGKQLPDAVEKVQNSANKQLEKNKEIIANFFQDSANLATEFFAKAITEDEKFVATLLKNFGIISEVRKQVDTTATSIEIATNTEKQRDQLKKLEDTYNNFFRNIRAGYERQFADLQLRQTNLIDQFKISGKGVEDSIRDNISSIRKGISDSQNEIKSSMKAVFNDVEKVSRESFDRSLKNLLPVEQFNAINRRIGELRKQGADLFNSDDPETIRQGRAKFEEAQQLIIKQQDISNQAFKATVRQQNAIDKVREAEDRQISRFFENETRLSTIQTQRQNEQIIHLNKLKIAGDNQSKKDEESIRHAQALDSIRSSNRPDLDTTAKDQEILRILNQQNASIRGRQPFLDLNNQLAEKGRILQREQLALEAQGRENLRQKVEEDKARVQGEEARLRRVQQLLKEISTPLFDKNGNLKKGFIDADDAANKLNAKILELTTGLKDASGNTIKAPLLNTNDLLKNPQFLLDLQKLEGNAIASLDAKISEKRIAAKQEEAQRLIDIEKSILLDLEKGIPANAKALQDKLKILQGSTNVGFFDSNNIGPAFDNTFKKIQNFATAPTATNLQAISSAFENLKARIDLFNISVNDPTAIQQFEQGLQGLKDNMKSLADITSGSRINDLIGNLRNIAIPVDQSKLLGDSFEKNKITIEGTAKLSQDLANALERAARASANIKIPAPGGFAAGGPIRGPGGNDNLLIRAEAGEFVMNRESTRRFFPQLLAMNSIRGFADGGLVNNNTSVGDININVTGGDTAEQTVRAIGQGLQRQFRRGTLRF